MKRDGGRPILPRSMGMVGRVNEQPGLLHDEIVSLLVVITQQSDVATRASTLSAEAASVIGAVAQRCRHHEVSILIFGATGVGRCFGCCPRRKVSMMRMRLPQQGQGCSGAFGSSGLALAALMASIGMRGTASSWRIRAILRARVLLVRKP